MDELKIVPMLDRLTGLAKQLNELSDEFGKPIDELDEYLKKLNLGLNCWTIISDPGSTTKLSIGYTKLDRWGIALSRTENGVREDWLYNNAPRWLRLRGIRFIPELFHALIKTAEAAIERVEEKTTIVKDIVKDITESK